jgi:hypothetical protein
MLSIDTLAIPVIVDRRDYEDITQPMPWKYIQTWLYTKRTPLRDFYEYLHSGSVGTLRWAWNKVAFSNSRPHDTASPTSSSSSYTQQSCAPID